MTENNQENNQFSKVDGIILNKNQFKLKLFFLFLLKSHNIK
jgi:hypothetical protein